MNCPNPKIEDSRLITGVDAEPPEHLGRGDMWPLTWARGDQLYAAAGDNSGIPKTTYSPMNLYAVRDVSGGKPEIEEAHHLPIDPETTPTTASPHSASV